MSRDTLWVTFRACADCQRPFVREVQGVRWAHLHVTDKCPDCLT